MYTDDQSPMYGDIPKSAEVAAYLDENRRETNRYYDRQYQHDACGSYGVNTSYVDANSIASRVGENPEKTMIRREAYAALEKALAALDENQRRRFCLHVLEDWSFERIAKTEGVSADAVRHQYERTCRRLRALLADWTRGDFLGPDSFLLGSYPTRRTMENRLKKSSEAERGKNASTAPINN